MKRVKKDAASFQQLGTAKMKKVRGGEFIEVLAPDGSKIKIEI